MIRGIRKHLRDLVAIALLLALGLGTAWVIVQNQRLRVPVLQERPFELKAEFETAQSVVPGQGQTLRVSGVRIGDVDRVELEDGIAIVTFGVDRDYLPIFRDATILLRPQSGLKDMFFQLDPGTPAAGEIEEGGRVPLANTAPDVNLDEILEMLDADTQAYLRLLLVGGGRGLEERGRDLGRTLAALGPINRDLRRLNAEVAKRKRNLARLVTNFNRLSGEVARADRELTRLVEASADSLGAIAERDPDLRRAVALLPGTLERTRVALTNLASFAAELGPAAEELRPLARNLPDLNASLERLAAGATPILAREIRPFVRAAREPVPDLRRAARRLGRATPPLRTVGRKVNRLGNMAAFNPNGAEPPGTPGRDEGYLFWAAWLSHNANTLWTAQDAHGVYRRLYLTMGCEEALSLLGSTPLAPATTGLLPLFAPGGPFEGEC